MPLFIYERPWSSKRAWTELQGLAKQILEDVTACNSETSSAQQCLAFRRVPQHEPKNQRESECGAIYLAMGQRLLN